MSRSSSSRRMLAFLLTVTASYALLCVLVFAFQRRLIFVGGPPPSVDPSSVGLDFVDRRIQVPGGDEIHAWRTRAPGVGIGERRRIVVLAHGNAGNIAHRLNRARVFADLGFDCLLFDYRGFGKSTGSPDEESTYVDAELVYDTLGWQFEADSIVVFGESLGGAVAVELALRREVAGVVLESTFTSLPDIAAHTYPFLPARWLALDRYETEAKLGRLDVPVLVLHGRGDEIVPFEMGERLAAAAGAELVELPGGHNDGGFLQTPELIAEVGAFLDAVTLRPSGAGR